MNASDPAETISQNEYELHCLLIYRDLTTLREFYSNYIQKQMKANSFAKSMSAVLSHIDSGVFTMIGEALLI